jgi:superfamily II DNA or RNA helicase
MSNFPPPRDFQVTAQEALREGIRNGHKNQLLMSPTGSGKSYIGLKLVSDALDKGKRAIFVCDRTTLIDQTSATADRYGLGDHGIIQANHWRTNYAKRFQIASAQTLARRKWPDADLIVIDEAHTLLKAVTDHIMNCTARVVGLSATPFSKGLGKYYSNLINATSIDALTRNGDLVPMRVYSCTKPDMRGAATAGGEWTDSAASERGMDIVGDVVAEWTRLGEGRKTIVFGATIAHCEELCRQFIAAGVMAAVFCADTTPKERAEILEEYRKPDSSLKILISVEALAKGFDVPDVSCLCDCRPLRKSLSTAIQMWGRALRSSKDTGKTDAILLDFSGNIIRFHDDYENIFFNGLDKLDDGEKLDKEIRADKENDELKGCPSCGFKPFKKRCMACGFEVTKPSEIGHLPGVMEEIVIGKKKVASDKIDLWQQACAYAVMHSAPDKQRGRASHIYKDIVGAWPPSAWGFEPAVRVNPALVSKIKSKNIAYAKARMAA